jgi:hypothetical protein
VYVPQEMGVTVNHEDEVIEVEVVLPELTESQCLAMCEAIQRGSKDLVIEKMKGYTISKEFQTAIDLALKNN